MKEEKCFFFFETDPKIKKRGAKMARKCIFGAFYEIPRDKSECREARRICVHATHVNEGESDG